MANNHHGGVEHTINRHISQCSATEDDTVGMLNQAEVDTDECVGPARRDIKDAIEVAKYHFA